MSEAQKERSPEVGVRWHPYADIFPWIEGPAFDELKADIAKNGVLDPIVFLDGAILDGRNRYMAARALGIEYPRVEYEGDDPLSFVLSKNLARRHLTESQRAMVAAKLANMPAHRPSADKSPDLGTSVADAARSLNVGRGTVENAKAVQRDGAPELISAVESGEVSVSAAAEVAKLPQEEQARVVADHAAAEMAKELREKRKAEREAEKAENQAASAEVMSQLPADVQAYQQAKAEAIAARKAKPIDVDAMAAELEQANETIAALEAEVATLKADNAKWEGMRVQFEQGGFEAVIAGKDEVIRAQASRIERESQEKVANLRSADWWKKKAIELGYSSREIIEING